MKSNNGTFVQYLATNGGCQNINLKDEVLFIRFILLLCIKLYF